MPTTTHHEISPDSDSDSDTEMASSSSINHTTTTTTTIPDDVHLSCNCHFHWNCLVDSYSYSTCPSCSRSIITTSAHNTEKILVDLHNEGGLQEGIDIMPILQEESYLRAYPEETKCRAFLEFCREGDHRAVAELLRSCAEDEEEEEDDEDDGDGDEKMDQEPAHPHKTADEILRYQDPVGDMQSGLHAAVANGHREVAWMLLLLASEYPELEFPALVFQEAAALGVMREAPSSSSGGKVDIRSLKDAHGRTAEDVAREAGVIWHGWVGKGRLAMPTSGSSGGGDR